MIDKLPFAALSSFGSAKRRRSGLSIGYQSEKEMRSSGIIGTLISLLASLVLASSLAAQEGLKRVRIAYPDSTICCLPLFAALQWKVFEANGLHAEIVQVRSQIAYPALSSGEVQYVAGVGPASVSATLRGMPSREVWFATEELIYSLIARADFQNVKDLRNKKIGLTGIGGTSHVSLQVALESVGENPKNFVYLGMGGTQVLQALEAGTVDAALLSPPMLYFAKKKGFRDLLDVGSRVKMPLGGLTVMVSTLRSRPDEVKRLEFVLLLNRQPRRRIGHNPKIWELRLDLCGGPRVHECPEATLPIVVGDEISLLSGLRHWGTRWREDLNCAA